MVLSIWLFSNSCVQNVDSNAAIRDIQVTLALASASLEARNKQMQAWKGNKEDKSTTRNAVNKCERPKSTSVVIRARVR